MTNLDRQRHHFADKGPYSQSYGFPSSHVQIWVLDYKEGWAQNWCFSVVVLEKTLESLLDCKEIKQSILKEINPVYSLEGPMLNLSSNTLVIDAKSQLISRDPDARKYWRQEEKGGDRGWMTSLGWMTSPTQWIWVWAHHRGKWRTGKPGVLQSMGSPRGGHRDRTTTLPLPQNESSTGK